MKKILLSITTIVLISGLVSCSSSSTDESSSGAEDNSIPTTYFPMRVGNFWDYDVQNRASNNTPASTNTGATMATDHLFVDSEVMLNSFLQKKMATTLAVANGFFSSILKDNHLRIDGTRLRATGTLTSTLVAGNPISIPFSDFIVLKDNAVAGTQLSTTNGTQNQTIQGNPLTFNYTLTSFSDGTLSTFTSNGVNYTNVKKTKLVLNMTVTGTIAGFPATVLPAQDVIVSTLHFVANKGMIYDSRVLNYQINAGIATTLGIPSASNQLQEEYLTNSFIQP